LGFLVVDPKCDGPCTVELVFDGGSEMHRAKILRILGICAALLWMWWWARPWLTSPARSGIVLKKY
jgi:hypothetical protein